jgi:hypothetical protein
MEASKDINGGTWPIGGRRALMQLAFPPFH